MIRHIPVRLSFVSFLIMALNLMVIAPCRVVAQEKQVRVGFLGVRFEGLPEKVRDKIQNDFLAMLEIEPAFKVQTPSDIRKSLGAERVDRLLNGLDPDSLLYLCSDLGIDHLYAAKIENQSKDSSKIILVGSFNRYDRLTGATYSYSMLKYYDDFPEELRTIKEQFILTVIPRQESILTKWPFFVVAGLAVVGIFILILSRTGGGEVGDRPVEPTPT